MVASVTTPCSTPRGFVGALLQIRGQGREELQPRRGQLAAEPELGCRPDEERLRFGSVEAGELRPVAALQAIAARRPTNGDDRDAGLRERLRVALHRSATRSSRSQTRW
jgi:hypothetical protein